MCGAPQRWYCVLLKIPQMYFLIIVKILKFISLRHACIPLKNATEKWVMINIKVLLVTIQKLPYQVVLEYFYSYNLSALIDLIYALPCATFTQM